MVPVDEDLGLDDRNKSGLLANTGVPRETMSGFINSVVRGTPLGYVNAQGGPPLCKTSALGVVELTKARMSVNLTVQPPPEQTEAFLYEGFHELTTHLS